MGLYLLFFEKYLLREIKIKTLTRKNKLPDITERISSLLNSGYIFEISPPAHAPINRNITGIKYITKVDFNKAPASTSKHILSPTLAFMGLITSIIIEVLLLGLQVKIHANLIVILQ